ncbi:MAG: hypothetical protein ACO1OT_02230, partial [Heyndrickxia sp.]
MMDNQDIHKMLKDLPMDKEIPIATSQKIVNMLENTESFSEKRNNKTYWLLPNIKVLIAFSLCIIIGIPLLASAIKESGSLSDGSSYEERTLLSEFMDLLSDAHYHKKDFRIIKTEINKNDGFVIYLDR